MLEMNSFQLLSTLRPLNSHQHIPVVMLTSKPGADIKGELKRLTIEKDDYTFKAFDEEELLARVQNLLEEQKAKQEATTIKSKYIKSEITISANDRTWLESFEAYVEKYLDSSLLSVAALAHEFAMSQSTLLRQLKRLTGLSPVKYLLEMRLDRAKQIIEKQSHLTIAQIASKVGYSDTRNFSRSFQKRYGKRPSAYSNLF